MDSPCNTCGSKGQDKNSEECTNCVRRIEYCVKEGMLSREVVEGKTFSKLDMNYGTVAKEIKEARKLIREKPRAKPKQAKVISDREGVIAYVAPDKTKKTKGDRIQLNFHFSQELIAESEQLMNDLKDIAKKELRRTTEQALYFIREGIERYKSK